MGSTRQVRDPVSGELVWVTEYVRNGKLVKARLPPHLFRDGLTPSRMEAIADFAEAASTAFGKTKTGPLPPAAEAVQRVLGGRRRSAKQRQVD